MKFLLFVFAFLYVLSPLAQVPKDIQNYYPKPKISSIEFLIGPSMTGVIGNEKPSFIYGQSYTNPGTSFGVPVLEKRYGNCFGISVSHYVSHHFSVYARLLYEKKGFVRGLDSLSYDGNFELISRTRVFSDEISNTYITLSVLPQYMFGNKIYFNIGAGPYLGLLSSSRSGIKGQPASTIVSDGAYNKYDFGFSMGAGLSYPLKNKLELTFQVTANYGLTQISDFYTSHGYSNWYNSSFSVLAGIRYCQNKTHDLKPIN